MVDGLGVPRRQQPEAVVQTRKDGYTPMQIKAALPLRESSAKSGDETNAQRRPARLVKSKSASANLQQEVVASSRIPSGTPLSWILHTSQLSLTSTAGTDEQYVDATGDLVADERTTFDASGGSFDIAVGRSGARYEVYSATLNNRRVGVLSVALDTNGSVVGLGDMGEQARQAFRNLGAVLEATGCSFADVVKRAQELYARMPAK